MLWSAAAWSSPLVWEWWGWPRRGDEGADKSDAPRPPSSTSDTDPVRLFLPLENALLKELLSWKWTNERLQIIKALIAQFQTPDQFDLPFWKVTHKKSFKIFVNIQKCYQEFFLFDLEMFSFLQHKFSGNNWHFYSQQIIFIITDKRRIYTLFVNITSSVVLMGWCFLYWINWTEQK